jgi:AcrR family transcriptional regulator
MAALSPKSTRPDRRSGTQRRRLPREQREQQMLAVARALFADRGYAAVTMDDVAASAGITKPLLYNYFGNKEGLYLGCMAPAGDALVATVIEAVAETTNAADALEAGLSAFFTFLAKDRSAWRVLFDETLPASGEVARGVAVYRDRLGDLVGTALLDQLPEARRELATAEVQALSSAVLGAAEALGRWWLRNDSMSADGAADMLIATLGPGLRARAATPRTNQAKEAA